MQGFQRILVGVDIAQLEKPKSAKFSPPAEEAIRQGIWLAGKASASLTFIAVLDADEHSLDTLPQRDQKRVMRSMENVASGVLDELVGRAQSAEIKAARTLKFGKGWVEIIREVVNERHDLTIVGTRDLRIVKRMLLGSTAMKLLRKCPGAVWVTKPAAMSKAGLRNIAVASDFSPVSDSALEAGVAVARCAQSQVFLVNSVDYPLDRMWATSFLDKTDLKYHASLRLRAESNLRKQLSRVDTGGLPKAVHTNIVEGLLNPGIAILDFVKKRNIDLLAMGTMGRGGVEGMFIGNTAERLLPQLPCSVLAVKPADFICPIKAK